MARAAIRAERTEKRCSVVQPTLDYVERHWKHQPALPNSDLALFDSTRLEPGARVRFATSEGGAGARFQLSSGTAPPADEPRYHVAALIPKLPWRAPNPEELTLLRAEPNPAPWQLEPRTRQPVVKRRTSARNSGTCSAMSCSADSTSGARAPSTSSSVCACRISASARRKFTSRSA